MFDLDSPADDDGPTPDDLAAIEREWPLIEAELALLDAQVALLRADRRTVGELDWRRLRRHKHAALNAVILLTGQIHGVASDRRAA